MTALRHAALGLLVVVLTLLLREAGFRGAKLLSLIGTVALVGLAVSVAEGAIDTLGIRERLGNASEELSVILKIIGVGVGFGIISDAARDMGESGVANSLLVVGRVEILALCLPSIVNLLDVAAEYFK